MIEQVVAELLQGHEYSLSVSQEPPDGWPFPNDAREWLVMWVEGERFFTRLVTDVPETDGEREVRVRSELGDWIAESGFGWGTEPSGNGNY